MGVAAETGCVHGCSCVPTSRTFDAIGIGLPGPGISWPIRLIGFRPSHCGDISFRQQCSCRFRRHSEDCPGDTPLPNQRGKVYVDRLVQGALARRIVAHWFLFFALAVVILSALELFLGDPALSLLGHLQVLWGKYAFFLVLMAAILPSFVYDTVKLSNRYVGPVLRLRESISDLAQGKPVAELKFRENDFWREIAEDFNVVAKNLHDSKA